MSYRENYVPHTHFNWDFSLSSNPFGPSPSVSSILKDALTDHAILSQYPKEGYPALVRAIADFYHVDPAWVILGAGLDGLIFDTINILLTTASDVLLMPTVTFQNARYAAAVAGAAIKRVPMHNTLAIDFDRLIHEITPQTKIVFICNPNNPTGLYEPLENVVRLLEATDALVLVDEANIEFSGKLSVVSLVEKYPHLMVLRSFSKAYGLAGMRVGYGISRSSLVDTIRVSRPPFFMAQLAELTAIQALADQGYMHTVGQRIAQEIDFLTRELQIVGFSVVPSCSNTVLCRVPAQSAPASQIIKCLNLRDMNAVNGIYFGLDDTYMRIAPQQHEANKALVQELARIIVAE